MVVISFVYIYAQHVRKNSSKTYGYDVQRLEAKYLIGKNDGFIGAYILYIDLYGLNLIQPCIN